MVGYQDQVLRSARTQWTPWLHRMRTRNVMWLCSIHVLRHSDWLQTGRVPRSEAHHNRAAGVVTAGLHLRQTTLKSLSAFCHALPNSPCLIRQQRDTCGGRWRYDTRCNRSSHAFRMPNACDAVIVRARSKEKLPKQGNIGLPGLYSYSCEQLAVFVKMQLCTMLTDNKGDLR